MKSLLKSIVLALAIVSGATAVAQTFDQAMAAYEQQDYKTAFAGFQRLAEQGNSDAQTNLAILYASGQGVPKDEQQAIFWYRKAAEQGNSGAQGGLGRMYSTGRGVPKDSQQAAAWFRKAADQGFANGQFNLGLHYAKGEGVPKDAELTYFWWLLSSAQGNADALSFRDPFEKTLTPQQRANAQAAARNWKPK